MKRSKVKVPDIERALSNWAKNHQRQGLPLNDSIIRKEAEFFEATVGNSDCHVKVNSTSWLEEFKQKNNLSVVKARKWSDLIESDGGLKASSNCPSGSQTPGGFSPIIPTDMTSPTTMSPNRSQSGSKTEEKDLLDTNGYNHAHSQSTTFPPSVIPGYTAQSFSAGPTSPLPPLFSPDLSFSSLFTSSQPAGLGTALQSDFPNAPGSSEQHHSSSTPNINNKLITSGTTSMPPPPTPTTLPQSPPGSPSQDEARRAMEVVISFFKQQPSGLVDPQEYITMGKLMEKLTIRHW